MRFRNCYFAFFANVCLVAQTEALFSVHFYQQKFAFSFFNGMTSFFHPEANGNFCRKSKFSVKSA